MRRGSRGAVPLGAVAALMFNAFVWGVSWWPLRAMDSHGLHPLWATALIFVVSSAVILLARPAALGQCRRQPALLWLLVAAGTTNASFNWGVVAGDVVRVVLLFYLMPLWSLLLARVLLGERLRSRAVARVLVALTGAAIVLWPRDGAGLVFGVADLLGLLGGLSFAFNNVMLRRLSDAPQAARALSMFAGGAVVSAVLALALQMPAPSLAGAGGWLAWLLPLAVAFLASNLALQHGAARLPASVTALVMLSEIVFATVSAVLLGGGRPDATTALGGLLILGSACAAVLVPDQTPVPAGPMHDHRTP